MGKYQNDDDIADYYDSGLTDEDFELDVLADDTLGDDTKDMIMAIELDGERFDDL